MNLADLKARAWAVRQARGEATQDPREEFGAGVELGLALFLVREGDRHRGDIREIEVDLAVLVERYPWLGPALVAAGPLEHVDVG